MKTHTEKSTSNNQKPWRLADDPQQKYLQLGNQVADSTAKTSWCMKFQCLKKLETLLMRESHAERLHGGWFTTLCTQPLRCLQIIRLHSRCEEEPEPQPLPNSTQENYVLDPSHLVSAHGEEIMHRMLWGATYSAYLYDFLKQLQWDTSPHTHTQWVELLISFNSFQLYTHRCLSSQK